MSTEIMGPSCMLRGDVEALKGMLMRDYQEWVRAGRPMRESSAPRKQRAAMRVDQTPVPAVRNVLT